MSESFVSRNHSVGINAFHLEWCPKYRFRLLGGAWLRQALSSSIINTAKQYNIQIFAMEISADHLHIFVNLPATLSVSTALQLFKGRSAKEIFAACPSLKKYTYFKGHFWSRGSFYRSVSNVSSSTVYTYISGHKSKELKSSVSEVKREFEQMNLITFM